MEIPKRSQQRGHVWEMISDSLNDIVCPKFSVTQKSVRDHYTLLQKQQTRRLREEEKASGISPEPSEVEIAIEEIIELFRSKDDENKVLQEKQKENCAAEVQKKVEMRQLSTESLAESKKKKSQSNDGEKPKRRMSSPGIETIPYLQKSGKLMLNLRRRN